MEAKEEELSEVNEIGPIIAKSVNHFCTAVRRRKPSTNWNRWA